MTNKRLKKEVPPAPLVRPTKELRIVVRVTTDDDRWLREESVRTDDSVGKVIRRLIKKEREERQRPTATDGEGYTSSFNEPVLQVAGYTS